MFPRIQITKYDMTVVIVLLTASWAESELNRCQVQKGQK